MKKWVSTIEKREFLYWFLQNYRLKHPEARRLLEFIMNSPHILENVSFTEKRNDGSRTIVISSLYSDEDSFAFYQYGQVVSEVANAISSIMQNPSDDLSLVLNFHGKMLNHRYLQLVETSASENISLQKINEQHAKQADLLMKRMLKERQIQTLREEIDRALDEKNEDLFKQLTVELQKLQPRR
jgi:uncharacterized protein YpiB (UPF0302 family)